MDNRLIIEEITYVVMSKYSYVMLTDLFDVNKVYKKMSHQWIDCYSNGMFLIDEHFENHF